MGDAMSEPDKPEMIRRAQAWADQSDPMWQVNGGRVVDVELLPDFAFAFTLDDDRVLRGFGSPWGWVAQGIPSERR